MTAHDRRRAVAPLPPLGPEPTVLVSEALRRRVYLWTLTLGSGVLISTVALQLACGQPDYIQVATAPLQLALCLWAAWWLLTRRPLVVAERTVFLVNAVAILVNLSLGAFGGDMLSLSGSNYWTLVIMATLGFLVLGSREALRFTALMYGLSVALPWAALWYAARSGPETRGLELGGAGELLRVQLTCGVVLALLSLLARYRDQFAAERGERLSLEKLAGTDMLTQLPNRRALYPAIERLLEGAGQDGADPGQPACLILLDLDHFKRVNDTYGHNVGDDVLTQVAATLRADLRTGDSRAGDPRTRDPGTGDIVGRWGGEEFLIVLPGLTPELGELVAGRLRARIAREVRLPHTGAASPPAVGTLLEGAVTASLGVAACQPGDDMQRWVARADAALYEAKALGRNRVVAQRGEQMAV